MWYARRQANLKPEEKKERQERKMNQNEERDRISVYLSGQQRSIIRSALETSEEEQTGKQGTGDGSHDYVIFYYIAFCIKVILSTHDNNF